MSSAIYTALNDMVSMLKSEWTDGQTPNIKAIWEEKSAGFIDDRRDLILVYPKNESIEYFGLYGSDFLHVVDIAIETRSYMNQEKIDNVNKEILRIIKTNIRRTGFIDLLVVSTISQNDQLRNMFKHVVNARYRIDNP
jgi:hypothetical protein